MPKLEALTEIRYGGKTVKKGETFDVRDKDVKILTAIKKAKEPEAAAAPAPIPPAPKVQRRSQAPKVEKAEEPKPVEPKAAEATQPWTAPGTYQRRDLKAED
jgi:hypothetical protein